MPIVEDLRCFQNAKSCRGWDRLRKVKHSGYAPMHFRGVVVFCLDGKFLLSDNREDAVVTENCLGPRRDGFLVAVSRYTTPDFYL